MIDNNLFPSLVKSGSYLNIIIIFNVANCTLHVVIHFSLQPFNTDLVHDCMQEDYEYQNIGQGKPNLATLRHRKDKIWGVCLFSVQTGPIVFFLLLLGILFIYFFFCLWTLSCENSASLELRLHDYNTWKHTLAWGIKVFRERSNADADESSSLNCQKQAFSAFSSNCVGKLSKQVLQRMLNV